MYDKLVLLKKLAYSNELFMVLASTAYLYCALAFQLVKRKNHSLFYIRTCLSLYNFSFIFSGVAGKTSPKSLVRTL